MIRKLPMLLLLTLAITVLCSWSLLAQNSMLHFIHISDANAAKDTATMEFGNHLLGTYDVDAAIGELASPPDPPGFFVRWVPIQGRNSTTWGSFGLLAKDIRDIPSNQAKKDSFYLNIKNADAADLSPSVAITLSWPDSNYINARCDSMVLVITGDPGSGSGIPGNRINMSKTNTVTLNDAYTTYDPGPPVIGWNSNAPVLKLRIFKYGTHQPNLDAVRKESDAIPASFALHQNYPNPFNPVTNFNFDIRNQGMTDISIYNMLGQKVTTLVAKELPVGTYSATWNGTNAEGSVVNSGVYFVRMSVQANGTTQFSAVRKMVMMK